MWEISKRVKTPYPNVEHIFPLKQHAVEQFLSAVCVNTSLQKVAIFGSSVEARCNPWSDVDIYVEGIARNELPSVIDDDLNTFDVWCSDEIPVGDPLLDEITSKGVVVYERRNST